MFDVLGYMLAWNRPLKQSSVDKTLSHFMNADGAGSATDALEVMVGKTTDCVGRIDDQATDAISSGHVVDAAFHLPARELGGDAFGDGLRIVVIAVFNHNDPNAFGVVLGSGPDAMAVVFAHDHDERGAVEAAEVGEGAGGVASTGADEPPAAMVVQALNGRNRFHVLEAPRGAQAALLGPIAVEIHPKVGEAHRLTEGFSTVGHGAGDVVVGL